MDEYRFKTQPYAHQRACFDLNKDKKFFAYLMDMGTGKSKVLLDTAAYMYDQGWINALLIFANKGSYLNWYTSEIPTHLPDHIPRSVVVWRTPMGQGGLRELDTLLTVPFSGLKVFLVNVEALSYPKGFAAAMSFAKAHQTLTASDESTTLKNFQAKRTKAAYKVRDVSKVRRIMTGSLVDNNPLDAYSQFEFLAPQALGFSSFYSFRAHFAEMIDMQTRSSPRPFKVVTGFKNVEDLKQRIQQHSFLIRKEECLDLPPKVYQTYEVELTDEQKKLYEELKKRSITEIQGEVVSVKIILTKLLRLHQLVCGHLKDDAGGCHEVPNNRISALLSVIEEVSGQILIWANYREDILLITKTLKEAYGEKSTLTYFGDTEEEERKLAQDTLRRGNDAQGVRFLVGNPQTGAYGLNLTGANTVIYYSNSFDAEKRNQSEDRAHRIGQTEKVTYVDLVAKGTVDEKILATLKKKKGLAQAVTVSNWKEFF